MSAEKSHNNLVAARKSTQTPNSNISEDESLKQLRLKIQNRSVPGNAASKLEALVKLPFRVFFGFVFL